MTSEQTKQNSSVLFPQIPAWRAVPFMVVTTLVMAYSSLLSVVPILILYAIWLPHIIYGRRFNLLPSWNIVLPVAFAVYCVFTLFWSGYSKNTIVTGVEYLSMIICTILIARLVPFEAVLKGLAIGTCLVLLVLFHKGYFSFTGLFGSKNQVGLYAEIGIFVSLLLYFRLSRNPLQLIGFVVIPFALGGLCLALSHSASSLVSLLVVLAVCIFACIMSALPKGLKVVALGLVAFAAATIVLGLYAFDIDLQGEILKALGKNPTLTGRTWLWGLGIDAGLTNPILGYGYNGFWMPGQPLAERMWAEFDVTTKTGFHFHNAYIQTFVDLGAIGLVFVMTMIFLLILKSLRPLINERASVENLFLLGMTTMLLVRSAVEVDFLGPFGIGVLLFYYLMFKKPEQANA